MRICLSHFPFGVALDVYVASGPGSQTFSACLCVLRDSAVKKLSKTVHRRGAKIAESAQRVEPSHNLFCREVSLSRCPRYHSAGMAAELVVQLGSISTESGSDRPGSSLCAAVFVCPTNTSVDSSGRSLLLGSDREPQACSIFCVDPCISKKESRSRRLARLLDFTRKLPSRRESGLNVATTFSGGRNFQAAATLRRWKNLTCS